MDVETKRYNVYAGLNGSFGGAHYQYTVEIPYTEDDVEDLWREAYYEAVGEYESYGGSHGLRDFGDILEEYCEEYSIEPGNLTNFNMSEIQELYIEEMEGWLDYRIIPTDEDDIDEKELFLR